MKSSTYKMNPLVEKDIEAWKQEVREAKQRSLDKVKLKVFESFLKKL